MTVETFDQWWERVNRTYDSDSPGFPNYQACWDASAKQYEDTIKGKILVDKEDLEFKVFRIAQLETALHMQTLTLDDIASRTDWNRDDCGKAASVVLRHTTQASDEVGKK